jgi:hypothetical protein
MLLNNNVTVDLFIFKNWNLGYENTGLKIGYHTINSMYDAPCSSFPDLNYKENELYVDW